MKKNLNEVNENNNNNSNKQQHNAATNNHQEESDSNQKQQSPLQPAAAAAISRPSPPKAAIQHPRQPYAQRPNLRRQVIVTGAGIEAANLAPLQHQHHIHPHLHHDSLELTAAAAAGVPIVPPKRPTRLPARYAAGLGIHGQPTPGGGTLEPKPNRYSWAQMQHWQAAAAAAAAAANKQQNPVAAAAAANQHHFSSPFSSAASRVLVVNPMQIVNLSEHTKSSLIKFIEALKRFSEKWFSHVLLLLFLAVYACLGAYIFISFEAPTENWEKQLIINTRLQIVNESWHEARSRTKGEFLDYFRVQLEDYERLLNRACASGMSSNSLENQWTFWGALFYSMTVFTTIGYGHLTPITFAGRVATMIYAIFGIPILLMVLADLGKLLTRIIKYAFKKFRYLFNKLLGRKSSIKTRKLISDNTHQYVGIAKDAFERGFTYMQHQPAALRVNSLRQKLFVRQAQHQHQHQQQQQELINQQNLHTPTDEQLMMDQPQQHSITGLMNESMSDVIITPGEQSKPVSPPIDGDGESPQANRSTADAVIHAAAASSHHNNHNHNNNQHQNNQHQHQQQQQHHHRSQSPAFRIRRKVSTSGLMGSRRHNRENPAISSSSKGHIINNLSKSSSSNVVHLSSSNKKLSDASTPTSVLPGGATAAATEQPTLFPVNSATCVADDKLKSDPLSSSDVDATTEGTFDVGAEFEMEDEDQVEEEEEDEFDIPVSFALFLLVTYMMFGAVVFSIWEGWNFFDSLYFVFISMSTIGFGDLVPQHPKRMIGTFIYLLFGLALTSMCINVVQEKIHATFLRAKMQIGEKMGFDLDQIMADDYYDGSLVYDVEGGGGAETEDANSLAVSQTNSLTLAADHNHHQQGVAADDNALLVEAASNRLTSHQSLDGAAAAAQQIAGHHHDQQSAVSTGLKQSKSRESLKGKKRSVTGITPGAGQGNALIGSSSGSSLKRKSSKKFFRQATPSTSTTTTTAIIHLPATDQVPATITTTTTSQTTSIDNTKTAQQPITEAHSADTAAAAATINVIPLRSQIEVTRTEPIILMVDQQQQQQQPGINAPINNVKSICEPLKLKIRDELLSADASSNRPKLVATRSLQPTNYQTEPGRRGSPDDSLRHTVDSIRRAGSEAPQQTTMQRRPPIKSSSYQGRSDLEAALSRRSSVSHELNQLDDLIVALGRSPSDKFGPLLGIPSSARSSRSNSPILNQRRGTSMTNRPTSNNRNNHHHNQHQPQPQATTLLPASVKKNTPAASHHIMQPLHNLDRESQAALDELEAIKFRS